MAFAASKRQKRPGRPGTESAPAQPPITTARPELTADGTGERFRQLVNDLFTIAVRMDAVRERFSQLIGVSPPQYGILMTVAQLEAVGGATVRAVAEHAHVSGAFVTAEAGKLAHRGLLAKRPNPADGRSVLLSLTAKGRSALEAALPQIRAVNDVFFGKLSGEDFMRLSTAAARIVDASAGAVLLAHAICAGARKPSVARQWA
ncbi:MAG: MarR family winged helix-turn-helix transcriptional regulator [Alphaproteobacteria bacterium]